MSKLFFSFLRLGRFLDHRLGRPGPRQNHPRDRALGLSGLSVVGLVGSGVLGLGVVSLEAVGLAGVGLGVMGWQPAIAQVLPAPSPTRATATPILLAQRPSQRIDRLQLRPGKNLTIRTAVLRGTQDIFLLSGRQGQTLRLRMMSLQNNSVFTVLTPSSSTLAQREQGEWQTTLPQTGEYKILISPTRGDSVYRLQVLIN